MQPTIINRPKMASLEDDKGKVNDVPPVVGTPPAESKPAAEARSASKPDKVASAAGGAVGAGGKLRWPAKGKVVNGFGQRSDGTHNDGIDVSVPMGTEVHAAEAGEVAYVGAELKAYGNLGAYMTNVSPMMASANLTKNVQSNYTIPLIEVATNSAPTTLSLSTRSPQKF